MNGNEYPAQHFGLVVNGAAKTYSAPRSSKLGSRPLTVDEAFPYSPFASVAPFNSGIVPQPNIGFRASTSLFANAAEHDSARQGLISLDEKAVAPRGTSQQLEKTLRDLKELLKPETLTEFKFKAVPTSAASNKQNGEKNPKKHLSPFAQMVYENTDIAFRSITPARQGVRTPNANTPSSQRKQKSPQVAKSKEANHSNFLSSTPNGHSSIRTSHIEVRIPPYRPSLSDPARFTPPNPSPNGSNINSSITVVIPSASEIVKTEEHVRYSLDPPTPQSHITGKRKRSETLDYDELQGRGSDQREKADESFRSLQELMQEVFEADEYSQMQGTSARPAEEYFTISDDGIFSLTTAVQMKLEILVNKLIQVGRFSQVPVDDMIRLQKLCEGSIKAAQTVPIKPDDGWGESDVEAWLDKLRSAEAGIRSARTSLRLMTGGREEKQLYSEEIIKASLFALKSVLDNCIVRIVEMRPSEPSSKETHAPDLFRFLSAQRKDIISILGQCRRLLILFTDLVANKILSDEVIISLEFTVSNLIFVENARSERESVLGVQKFDNLRVAAMDSLAQIFSSYPAQRRWIIDQVLTSLEKLPVNKQSARQFKLIEGGSIQPVSALIMRLVQVSANRSENDKPNLKGATLEALGEDSDEPSGEIGPEATNDSRALAMVNPAYDTEYRAVQQSVTAIQELREVLSPLHDVAQTYAFYVANWIIDRAETSTKSGDSPYRNLLDLFVQDFLACLNSMDWPAAELLLYAFLVRMVKLAENDKTAAPAKNMALDVLAEMGAAISQLNAQVRKPTGSFENADVGAELGDYILKLADGSHGGTIRIKDLIVWDGPYRAVLEYLQEQRAKDPSLQGALGYYKTVWALQVISSYDDIGDEDSEQEKIEADYGRVAYRLRRMITDRDWLRTEYNLKPLGLGYARLAYSLALMSSRFCNAYDRIFRILLNCIRSEQATVRSKSLKSINQVLETDPTILDRSWDVMHHIILDCADDPSVAVRDSALGLIGKCIDLKADLEKETIPQILKSVYDPGIGVRKRAIKLLKDIYLRNEAKDIRSDIAGALLHRIADHDEGVQELARQTMEEVWMQPFYLPVSSADEVPIPYRLAMNEHVTLMVRTMQRRSDVAVALDKVLSSMLSNASKHCAENFRVCKALVAIMFETIIDNSDGRTDDAQDALQLLMTFAKANPKLFTAQQIQLLPPYIQDLNDTRRFRSVVIIFRHVFPELSSTQTGFLIGVRENLMKAVIRLPRNILDDVVACLWIISGVLQQREGLARLAASSLKQITELSKSKIPGDGTQQISRKLLKILLISGMVGKHCDLDDQTSIFRDAIPSWQGSTVSKLMVDVFTPLAFQSQPLYLRKAALDSIGMVCQSWPKNFASVTISKMFRQVFDERTPDLENMILRSFKEFLFGEEKRSEPGTEIAVGAGVETPATLGVMGGSQHDGVAIEIAQKFLKDITRIALASQNEHALLATEILTSINRQGMNHPKDCGPALVALETSDIADIASLAFKEHRALHEKHETILEKEYMRAVQCAFDYQRDVVKETRGARINPYRAKLHLLMDVLKISKVKARKKFFENLCTRIDFDPMKLDSSEDFPVHVNYSRFVLENMAFFEYQSIEELLLTITAMEKLVAGTGTTVAHGIETEILKLGLGNSSQQVAVDDQAVTFGNGLDINPIRLRQLTAASMVLSGVWEARTYLRRTYGLTAGKAKVSAKDLSKPPVKVAAMMGDKFWDEMTKIMSALSSTETMMGQCRNFVELLTVDKDFKIAAEGEDDPDGARHVTPSDEEADGMPMPPPSGGGRGRKRKAAGTPSRKKRARSSSRGRSKKGRAGSAESDIDAEGEWE